MPSPTYDQLVTTTLKFRSNDIKDNVTNNNAVLTRLKEKGKFKSTSGGPEILERLSYATSPNTGWYSGYDAIPISPAEVLSASKWDWKQMADSVVLSGAEMRKNSGRQAMTSLVGELVDVLESSMKNKFDQALQQDGTGADGKMIVGLGAALSATQTSGTYGGIDRAVYPFWRAYTSTVTTTASNIRAKMAEIIVKRRRGNDKTDLIVAGDTKYLELNEALQGLQTYTNPKLAEAGFETLRFMGADVVSGGGIGGNATDTTMQFLNTNYWWVRYHPDANFNILGPETRVPVNQDAIVKLYGFMGAFTCSGLQFQGVGIFA